MFRHFLPPCCPLNKQVNSYFNEWECLTCLPQWRVTWDRSAGKWVREAEQWRTCSYFRASVCLGICKCLLSLIKCCVFRLLHCGLHIVSRCVFHRDGLNFEYFYHFVKFRKKKKAQASARQDSRSLSLVMSPSHLLVWWLRIKTWNLLWTIFHPLIFFYLFWVSIRPWNHVKS